MRVLQRGHSCDLVSTLCKYNMRKGDLFVMSLARVRQVRRGSISSELLMCGGGGCSIVVICLETINVCIWVLYFYCDAWSCMGNTSVSSCIYCMFVSCVHPVAICMTCSLLMQEATIWKRHTPEPESHKCLVGSHECILLFTPSCCSECFYDL